MGYSKDMIVADIVNSHPKAKDVLECFGLPCSRCVVAWSETLETGLKPHGIPPEDVLKRLEAEASPARPPIPGSS